MRLNLGAGGYPLADYENLDRKTGQEIYPLAYPDECADEVRASHVLEHFPYRDTLDVMREWVRVLKPGGLLRIAVPDFDWICNHRDGDSNTLGFMFGGQVDDSDYHYAGFNDAYLRECMRAVGINDIRPWKSPVTDCASLPVSLNLEGFKAPAVEIKRGDVVAIMSCPRLGFTENWFGITTVTAMGIPFERIGGAYWGQALTLGMENAINRVNPRYLLTIDYDSLFTKQDVMDLYRLAETSGADAVAAMQLGRERTTPLLTVKDEHGKFADKIETVKLSDDLMPVSSAHFGLTLLRTETLKKLPRPWFKHTPDEEGRWGEGRCDDDSHFWREWFKAGFTAYSANRVVIGHMQNVATWPDRQLRPVFQYLSDYCKTGKPSIVLR